MPTAIQSLPNSPEAESPRNPFGFRPDAHSRVRQLDRETREALATSLERLQARAGTLLPQVFDVAEVCSQIRAGRVSPGAFAAYFEMVPALQAGKRDLAADCWRRIGARPVEAATLRCQPVRVEELGEDAARFERLLSIGWREQGIFAPPTDADWLPFERDAQQALALLAEALPVWHAEVESLLLRIYGALPADGTGRGFSGASSRMVWGAIFINMRRHPDRLAIASSIVHEATHQKLFGLSQSQPLTENPPHERYVSPLRSEPRPMEGVYHATYVAARLALFNAQLRESSALSPHERETVSLAVPSLKQRFENGRASVEKDGKLGTLARELMDSAAREVAELSD
jgi:HEXXH motif-containing protein